MHGIVSLLDEDHYRMVEDVWAGLDEALGLRGVYVTPYPHFSYHVADHYDLEQVGDPGVRPDDGAFEVTTPGWAFTEGIHPVGRERPAARSSAWPTPAVAPVGRSQRRHH